MLAAEAITEAWCARTLDSYPADTRAFLRSNRDPFRNPVGSTLRDSLAVLACEVRGDMDPKRLAPALDAVVRIRAVQDLSPSHAVGFVFLLKDVLRDARELDVETERRIDDLALMAFDAYTHCREEVAALRIREALRAQLAARGAQR